MKRVATLSMIAVAVILSVTVLFAAEQPVKVFILVGQSNMQGKGQSGHLKYILDNPKSTAEDKALVQHLFDKEGNAVVRDDVWIWYLGRTGNLTFGYGDTAEKNGKPFGPEISSA